MRERGAFEAGLGAVARLQGGGRSGLRPIVGMQPEYSDAFLNVSSCNMVAEDTGSNRGWTCSDPSREERRRPPDLTKTLPAWNPGSKVPVIHEVTRGQGGVLLESEGREAGLQPQGAI